MHIFVFVYIFEYIYKYMHMQYIFSTDLFHYGVLPISTILIVSSVLKTLLIINIVEIKIDFIFDVLVDNR